MSTGWNNPATVDVAAIAAAVAASVDVPTVPEVQSGLARTDELSPAAAGALAAAVGDELITAAQVTAAVPSASDVAVAVDALAAAAAAITAAAGVAIPSVAQVQTGLATSSALSTVQSTVNALPSAANVQTACASAVTAAAGVAIPSVAQIQSGLATASAVAALPTAASVVSAITASGAISTQQQAAAQAAINATDFQIFCENAIDSKNIPGAVKALAVGATFSHTSVTLSGASTSGTVLVAQGAGSNIYVVAVAAACSVANTTFSLASSGGTTMGAMQLMIGTSFALSIPFGYVIRGGTNTSITGNKTTGATVVIDIWYYVA